MEHPAGQRRGFATSVHYSLEPGRAWLCQCSCRLLLMLLSCGESPLAGGAADMPFLVSYILMPVLSLDDVGLGYLMLTCLQIECKSTFLKVSCKIAPSLLHIHRIREFEKVG